MRKLFHSVLARAGNLPGRTPSPDFGQPKQLCPSADIEEFDEEAYLERYTDVAYAVDKGAVASGRAHYELYGRNEDRLATPIVAPERVDLKASSVVQILRSPELSTRPPTVIGMERIPEDLRVMYDALWRQDRPSSDITCHQLRDVIVVGSGLVFDTEGRLVAASAHQTAQRQIEQATITVREYLADGGGTAIGGTTLLCEKVGVGNYFHWLVEMAPIANALRDKLGHEWYLRAPIVDGAAGLTATMRDSLDLLEIDPARIRWAAGGVPQRYETLILTKGFSHHGATYSPLIANAFEAMGANVRADTARRIWVSRAGYQRRMQDEIELGQALAARGWTVVSPGTLSLRRQIALFKGAEVVAGVNGAGLTNIGFSPSSTNIIVFAPARIQDISFWMLAQMKGQPYTEIRCAQEHGHAGAFNWEGLLMMDTAEALHHIDAVLAK